MKNDSDCYYNDIMLVQTCKRGKSYFILILNVF